MVQCSKGAGDQFVVPDSENLKNLGPGCFVRVAHQSKNIWVEVTDVDGNRFKGIIHPELDDVSAGSVDLAVDIQVEQINALGCDRYCYCD